MKSPENRRGADWTMAELQQLGKTPDSVLARLTGRTIREVVEMREPQRIGLPEPWRRWTAREINLLGTMSDLEYARRLGRTLSVVAKRRVKLGITAYQYGGGGGDAWPKGSRSKSKGCERESLRTRLWFESLDRAEKFNCDAARGEWHPPRASAKGCVR